MLAGNELMINDWVMYNPNVFIEDEYEPTKEWFPTQINGGEDIDLAIEDCYTPIPLTPEILEKNGFKYMTDLWYIQTKELKPIQIVFKETNVITLSINCTPVPINLKHVHQLQHALRLYGIEKEIVL